MTHMWSSIMLSSLVVVMFVCILIILPIYSQYQIHHTKLRNSDSGLIDCNVRPKLQEVADVTDYNTEQMRLLHSPGFIINDPPRYEKHDSFNH